MQSSLLNVKNLGNACVGERLHLSSLSFFMRTHTSDINYVLNKVEVYPTLCRSKLIWVSGYTREDWEGPWECCLDLLFGWTCRFKGKKCSWEWVWYWITGLLALQEWIESVISQDYTKSSRVYNLEWEYLSVKLFCVLLNGMSEDFPNWSNNDI
jgi:hypothetical protein